MGPQRIPQVRIRGQDRAGCPDGAGCSRHAHKAGRGAGPSQGVREDLKLVRLHAKPLLVLLEQHGLEKGSTMIEKAYLRDKLLEQETDSKGRRIPRIAQYRDGKLVNRKAILPGHGAVTLETQQLTPSHVSLMTAIYKVACNLAQRCRADPGLVKTCKEEADRLGAFAQPNNASTPGN